MGSTKRKSASLGALPEGGSGDTGANARRQQSAERTGVSVRQEPRVCVRPCRKTKVMREKPWRGRPRSWAFTE